MSDGFKIELIFALLAADSVEIDGLQARYRVFRGSDAAEYVHLTLHDQTQRLGDGFKTFLLVNKAQTISLRDGEAKFRDSEGRSHVIVFYKNRRLQPQDLQRL